MRSYSFRQLARGALAAALWIAAPAQSAELYLSGELGISSLAGDGTGTTDLVPGTNAGSSKDASPVYGGALGMVFPLNATLPWRMRFPSFGVPYWPGRELRFHGGEDVRFPDWGVRVEVEYLRGRDVELSTQSSPTSGSPTTGWPRRAPARPALRSAGKRSHSASSISAAAIATSPTSWPHSTDFSAAATAPRW